eukprot:1921145-Amphidinium_carterae.2
MSGHRCPNVTFTLRSGRLMAHSLSLTRVNCSALHSVVMVGTIICNACNKPCMSKVGAVKKRRTRHINPNVKS